MLQIVFVYQLVLSGRNPGAHVTEGSLSQSFHHLGLRKTSASAFAEIGDYLSRLNESAPKK